MAYDCRVYRILIASPSDVEEERESAVRVIQEWNDLHSSSRKVVLLPLRWETHTAPEYGTRPQEVINRAIVDECDLLVGIFWTRLGSPTGLADSGTLEEIERVGKAGKPVMLYFSGVEIAPNKIDLEQIEKLKQFKEKTYPKGLVESYRKSIEFRDKFSRHLEMKIRELQEVTSAAAIRTALSITGPDLFKDHKFRNKNHWRMTVHNAGPAAARNVQVKLRSGTPGPKDSNWAGDFPYAVYPVGTITNDPGQINAVGRQINTNDDQSYEIACGWRSESGPFYTDINTKGGGHNIVRIDSDERWKLSYEVTAENALPIRFILELFIEDDEVKVALVSSEGPRSHNPD
jgi:hypothetical protein